MAAGCVPDALPWEIPLIANQAGFQSSGMWLDTNTTWNKNALSKTKESLEKTENSQIFLSKDTNRIDNLEEIIRSISESVNRNDESLMKNILEISISNSEKN